MAYTCRVSFGVVFVFFFAISNSFASSDFLKEYNDKILGKNYYMEVKVKDSSENSVDESVSLTSADSSKKEKSAGINLDEIAESSPKKDDVEITNSSVTSEGIDLDEVANERSEPVPQTEGIQTVESPASSEVGKEKDEHRIDSIDNYNAAILAKNYYKSSLVDERDANLEESSSNIEAPTSNSKVVKARAVSMKTPELMVDPVESDVKISNKSIAQYSGSNEDETENVVKKKPAKSDKLSKIRKEKELLKKRLGIE